MMPLFDAQSGESLALPNGMSMSPFRTGATNGVAINVLARDDASAFAPIGSGAQARDRLRTAVAVRDLNSV